MADETIDPPPAGFASLGLSDELVAAVTALGYEEPTPIQREAIPVLLSGRDVLGQAETGTGKTAAFALPMLQQVSRAPAARGQTLGLVLVPTRELAMQVSEAVHKYAKKLGSRVVPVYGGASMEQQIRALKHGAEVVVATPGRALDHIRRKTLALESLRFLVLDEADEMLDMGFAEELEAILEATPSERQTALFSATLPSRIVSIAERHLRNPVRVTLGRAKTAAGKLPRVRQVAYVVSRAHKAAALARVLDMESPASAIVFCRTRLEVETLVESLNAHGFRAEALHGGLIQRQRDRVMTALRAAKVDLIVATDVAARGLDIEHLSHVFNYDVPPTPEAYVHRIGRTGRVGRAGVAITLAEPREHRLLRIIEGFTKQKIEVATVPTVADLRARRLDLTKASLREQLLGGGLDDVRVVVEALAEEFDILDIAAAGVKLAHAATLDGGGDGDSEREIPSPPVFDRPRPTGRSDRFPVKGGGGARPPFRPGGRRPAGEPLTRIHVGAGRSAGVRPGDLVGAITGEAGIGSREIGAIEIADRFSLVEVPERLANSIVSALRASTIKGKKVPVRRERDSPAEK